MEVSVLEHSTDMEVLMIQYFKQNEPRLSKSWSTLSNLSEIRDDNTTQLRGRRRNVSHSQRRFKKEQRLEQFTENAKKFALVEEMMLLKTEILKPAHFLEISHNGNDKKMSTKCPTFERVFVIMF